MPEGWLEVIAQTLGLAPTPFADTLIAAGLAQTIIAGTRLGVFEAIAGGPRTAAQIAETCGTDLVATQKLLWALVGARYVRVEGSRYTLERVARKWLLRDGPWSLRDYMLMMPIAWQWLAGYEDYIRTGKPTDVHVGMGGEDWGLYQGAMRSLAGLVAPEVAWRTPVPRGARDMFDIGGSHGYFSVALCRRHARLRSTVIDLPDAVEHARTILEREKLGDRVVHRVADARTVDLGREEVDLVFVANLVHHFDAETNRDLVRRAARALRPGGALVIQEVVRPTSPEGGQAAMLGDLYFASLSAGGTWSFDDIAGWQREAGLDVLAPMRFLSVPSVGQQSAVRRS